MKVQNMTSAKGNKIANQFIITDNKLHTTYFQSYDSIIVMVEDNSFDKHGKDKIYLDRDTWDYSVTTGKYRNQFLGENKKETKKKIKSGEYILTDLN